MTAARLSANARRLLETDLDSFEKLEVTSRIRSTPAGLAVDDPALDSEAMRETVAALIEVRLVERRGRMYVFGSRATESAVVELLTAYDADRMTVVSELSSLAMERIRSMASRAFANAFVLRKKRGDDDG